jgi:formylglycine-generating enzyme required for sulfatase activity
MSDKIERKKFAVFNPELKLFLSADRGHLTNQLNWTDRFDEIQTYVLASNALDLIKVAQRKFPTAHLVEVTLSMTWAPVELFIEETPAFKKARSTYDKHLSAFEIDAEAMSNKDYRAFMDAREFLKDAGQTVCKR